MNSLQLQGMTGSASWLICHNIALCVFHSTGCSLGVPAAVHCSQRVEDRSERREFQQRGWRWGWRGRAGRRCQWRGRGGEGRSGTCSSMPQFPIWESLSNGLVSCLQEEVEPFPEERENFLQQLYKFMEDRGELSVPIPAFFVGLYPSVPLWWTQYLRNSLMEGLRIWPDSILVVRVKVTVLPHF